jgi:hypothetical protein
VVTDPRALQRLELALGLLWMTVAVAIFVVALDTISHHGLALEPRIALAALDGVIVGRALASLARRLRAERTLQRTLKLARTEVVHGHRVRVIRSDVLAAFCAGARRPELYVTEGTVRETGDAELRAILAHEEHHRARRDPLRLLLAGVISDAMRPLPPFSALAERHAALADLLADAASVDDARGDRAPLASAFMRFGAVAPERVDHLVGACPSPTVPAWLLLTAAAALAGLAALMAPILLVVPHPHPLLEIAILTAACVPACLAARRAGACLRPLR